MSLVITLKHNQTHMLDLDCYGVRITRMVINYPSAEIFLVKNDKKTLLCHLSHNVDQSFDLKFAPGEKIGFFHGGAGYGGAQVNIYGYYLSGEESLNMRHVLDQMTQKQYNEQLKATESSL